MKALTNQGKNVSLLSQLLGDSTHRVVTDVEIAAWNAKEPAITAGLTTQYWRGDKSWQILDTSVVPENGSLYWTQARFNAAFSAKSTTDLSEGTNLYFTTARAQAAISVSAPLAYSGGTVSIQQSSTIHDGYLSSTDWNTFNGKQAALGFTAENVANKATDVTLGGGSPSNTLYPSQAAVKAYADALIAANSGLVYKGAIDCSGNPNYPAASTGWTYKISVSGKIGGAAGLNVSVGDIAICLANSTPSGDQAAVGSFWDVIQVNLDGAVIGPVASTDLHFASFNGTGGKLIADSGYAPSSFARIDQTTPQTVGDTAHRLAKLWATDITVTNSIAGSVTGNAGTATALATARAINGTNFDGTAAITVPVNNTEDHTTNATMYPLFTATTGGNYAAKTSLDVTYNPGTATVSVPNLLVTASSLGIADAIVPTYFLTILSRSQSNNLSANRQFNINVKNADRTLTMAGDATLNQDVSTTGTPTFGEVTITGLTGSIITTANAKQSIEDIDDSIFSNQQSGFYSWGGAGDYWSASGANFSLLRPGTGYIKGKKITWTATQTIAIPANTTQVVCIDNTGTIQVQNEDLLATYRDYIPLFLALYDGSQMSASREHHFYGAPPRVVNWNHETLGIVVTGVGANITRVATGTGAAAGDRELSIVGADTIYDLLLTVAIPDSGGVGVTWDIYHVDGSGHWIRGSQAQQFPMQYDNAGTPTALATSGNGSYGVYNLYVAKDSVNTTTPVYIAVMDNSKYNNFSGANTAITGGTIAVATNELASLQIAHLGYIVVQNNVGGGFINTAIIAKSTSGSGLLGGGSGNSAALITVNTSTFANLFTSSDSTVQNALNTLDAAWSGTNWNTAYTERHQWDGGATNLVAATGRTSLGLGTMATQAASAVAITGGTLAGLTGLGIRDTSAAYDVTVAMTSSTTLTAARILTIDVVNSARTLKIAGNSVVDQDVSSAGSPAFVHALIQDVSPYLHLNSTDGSGTSPSYVFFQNFGGTGYVGKEKSAGGGLATGSSAYAMVLSNASNNNLQFGTNNTVRMTISNAGNVSMLGTLAIRDTSAAHDVILAPVSSVTLTADRTLTIDTANVSSTLKMGANLTVVGASSINGTIGSIGYLSSVAESNLAFTDITTANVTTAQHGLAPKGTAGTTQFWRQDWTLATITDVTSALIFDHTVTGSASTTVTTNGTVTLDAATHGGYEFEVLINNPTVSAVKYRLYFNNDTTNADYYTDIEAVGVTNDTSVWRTDATVPQNYHLVVQGVLIQDQTGLVYCRYTAILTDSNNVLNDARTYAVWKKTVVSGTPANLTRLDWTCDTSGGIGINSRFRLWRRM